jgi:polyhydroxyalkanoate synthase subunit PhaE
MSSSKRQRASTPENSANWTEHATALFNQWAEQQQNVFRSMTGVSHPLAAASAPAAGEPGSVSEVLREAQARWQSSMQQWTAVVQDAMPQAGITADALKTMLDPSQWAQAGLGPLDAAIEHLVDGPGYATLWTLDRKLLKAQQLRTEWAKDLATYQILMHAAWNEATKRFAREINDAQGAPITGWRELTDLWVDVVNATLLETHRTPEFLETQRRLTRSGAECRLQEREISEAFCEMQQMPTRTEMDEMQHAVYELRRQLRAMEKSVAANWPASGAARKATKKAARRPR